eukprot:351375-Chlamydomonas_euryale.AAC.16
MFGVATCRWLEWLRVDGWSGECRWLKWRVSMVEVATCLTAGTGGRQRARVRARAGAQWRC